MIKEYSHKEFPIREVDVDAYLLGYAEQYGDESDVFKKVNELFINKDREIKAATNGKWISYLNMFRKMLCESGFKREVLEQDEVFEKNMNALLSKVFKADGKPMREMLLGHKPMRDRWEHDDAYFLEKLRKKSGEKGK